MDNQITAKDKCMRSIWTTMNDYYSPSRSISVVPENLKKWNEDAYKPKVVSIGPRFKATKEEFLLMLEHVKVSCMSSLIFRASGSQYYNTFEECFNVVWQLDEAVRASYITKIDLEKEELAQIMLVDGCFLLELLIKKGLDSQLPSYEKFSDPAVEVLKDEVVLSDLMLFENQIPIMVLRSLSQTIFPNVFGSCIRKGGIPYEERDIKKQGALKFNSLVLSVLGYSPFEFLCLEANHILDLVHFHVSRRTVENTTMPGAQQEDRVNMDSINTTDQSRQEQQVKLNRCALRLLTSGITIKVKLPEDSKTTDSDSLSCFSWVWNGLCAILFWLFSIFLVRGKHLKLDDDNYIHELKGLDFWFKFEKGKLEIEQLHITKTTKVKWCNIIASEHHQNTKTNNERNDAQRAGQSDFGFSLGDGGKFTLAALIFNSLICSEDDVQLLKDKKIVVDHLKMTNQEIMDFFAK